MYRIIIIFLTIILGFVSGSIGGGLGLGVSTLALPGFSLLTQNVKTAIGTTFVASPASWPAMYQYYKAGHVDLLLGVIYVLCYMIASYYGAGLAIKFDAKTLNYLISCIHFLIGLYFFHRGFFVE